MRDDLITQFLGLDLLELQDTKLENDAEAKKLAVDIVKLTEYPEWLTFVGELDRLEKATNRPCEEYALHPNDAWVDVGTKRAIQIIKDFVKSQHKLIEKYVEQKTTSKGVKKTGR